MKPPGPSKAAEAIVAVLVPPACREEVLGDLYERFASPGQYALDALRTVPLVIISRIRRTLDPQILLIQAFVSYLSFLGAAWFADRALFNEPLDFMRLSIPAVMCLLGLILEDAYAAPGPRSALKLTRGPAIGLLFAVVSQGILLASNPQLVLNRWTVVNGCAMTLLLTSAVRIFFPPPTSQLEGANAPAEWLKRASGTNERRPGGIPVLKRVEKMTTTTKLLISGALIFALVTAVVLTTPGRRSGPKLTYTEFLDQVQSGRVASAIVFSQKRGATPVIGHLRDGGDVRSLLPSDYRNALELMEDRRVNIEIRDSSQALLGFVVNASPFLVLLAVWFFLMIRRVPMWRGGV